MRASMELWTSPGLKHSKEEDRDLHWPMRELGMGFVLWSKRAHHRLRLFLLDGNIHSACRSTSVPFPFHL